MRDKHAFSLTATTGAGKTVMAAAVFETLFHGDENFDFEPDPGAVVIWFSDDPSLNEQSRFRLLEASDRISMSGLVVVQNTFNRDKLEAGKIYFLNTQKLSRSSLAGKGTRLPTLPVLRPTAGQTIMPDLRSFTIWDTIQNTIEDPALTLYLVLGRGAPRHAAVRRERNRREADDREEADQWFRFGAGNSNRLGYFGDRRAVQRGNDRDAGAGHPTQCGGGFGQGPGLGALEGHNHTSTCRTRQASTTRCSSAEERTN